MRYSPSLTFTLVWMLWATGCTTGSQVDFVVRQSEQGTVYLDRIPDRHFQAAHPIRLDQALIARSLQGIKIHEDTGLLRALTSREQPNVPVFSGSEVAFLAPAIVDGLRQAAADQRVGFRLIQEGTGGYRERAGAAVGSSEPPVQLSAKETTSGHVFAYGRSLYISLHEYRRRANDPDTISMPNRRVPQPNQLLNRHLLFLPAEALRPQSFTPRFAEDLADILIIDYDALARLPAPTAPAPPTGLAGETPRPTSVQRPTQAVEPETDLRAIQDNLRRKDAEIEELRRELQDIKRQLDTQQLNRGSSPSVVPRPTAPEERTP